MAEKHSFTIWPIPQECIFGTGHLVLSSPLILATHGDAPWLPVAARQAAEVLKRAAKGAIPAVVEGEGGGPAWRVTTMETLPPGLEPVLENEGYFLDVTPSGVLLAGRDAQGVFWGAQTLAQLIEGPDCPSLPVVTIRDWPRYPIRGVHCYLPAREQM
ncbi:MAG: glycoside hydrolase family 20 zincin-like fold domain-containing protein, partial [Fidelibacterota bacterium]